MGVARGRRIGCRRCCRMGLWSRIGRRAVVGGAGWGCAGGGVGGGAGAVAGRGIGCSRRGRGCRRTWGVVGRVGNRLWMC